MGLPSQQYIKIWVSFRLFAIQRLGSFPAKPAEQSGHGFFEVFLDLGNDLVVWEISKLEHIRHGKILIREPSLWNLVLLCILKKDFSGNLQFFMNFSDHGEAERPFPVQNF